MAAATDAQMPEVVALRGIRVADLEGLLEEETGEWMSRLSWDFRPSADLVRRFVGSGSLAGYALISGGTVAGYAYFIHEDRKGLIGDLYVAAKYRTLEKQFLLLEAVLNDLFSTPGVERVESQLMLLRAAGLDALPFPGLLRVFPRNFMVFDVSRARSLKPGPASRTALIENWSARRHEDAARVIAEAYDRHIDSQVNDQYRSVDGARRFLSNIAQYPGCGSFFQPASLVAVDVWTGHACGICLASMLSPRVGHVTQLSVTPGVQGKGLGYELLRRSLLALDEAGCRQASLTVTAMNFNAVRLYEHMGFKTAHTFPALVWEKEAAG